MKRWLLSALMCLSVLCIRAQGQDRVVNEQIFNRVLEAVSGQDYTTTGELATAVAVQLLGTPYEGGSIEGEPERLRVFLDRTDCILFVELCVSFALTIRSGEPSYEKLEDNIRLMRYRNGIVDDFASRIHYTSEWLIRNASRGILREYSRKYGSEYSQKFNFMSSHPEYYPPLKGNPEEVARIQVTEEFLQNSGPYWAIRAERLKQGDVDIREGDIICFLSDRPGLDIAHVALAHRIGGEMRFIHASSTAGKVVVSDKSVADCSRNGVRLARLK